MGCSEILDCRATVEVISQAAAPGDTLFYTNRATAPSSSVEIERESKAVVSRRSPEKQAPSKRG